MPKTNKEKQAEFRKRNAALGRFEIRGIFATAAEQKWLKPMIREQLKRSRKAQ
jgi:hypothetical protein